MNKVMMNIQMLLMFILILHNYSAECADPLAPALFVFGDSLMDSGNNNLLFTPAKADYPPYGMNFDKGPTGRFTNGRTIADFTADYLGLPYSPPYMSLSRGLLHPNSVSTGLNYASGGCGILRETGDGDCLNIGNQLFFFERTVKNEIATYFNNSLEEVSNFLSKSVFVIATGTNDYKMINETGDDPSYTNSFADSLIGNLSQKFERLYNLGARKVIMFEMGPIGCMPSNIREFKPNGRCVEGLNQFALIFNDKLATMLQNLTSTLDASSFILGRSYELGYDAIINPSKYGLSNTSNPCCETSSDGITSTCILDVLGLLTCKHPENHYFFDDYNPTETVYNAIATLCFNGSSICTPNIQHLVSQDD